MTIGDYAMLWILICILWLSLKAYLDSVSN
jgi:hypothetical protein